MKQSSNFLTTVAGGLGAATFIALSVSGMAFWSANRTLETNRNIAQHLETLRSLQSLTSALKDTESMQRKYLLTGKNDALRVFGLRMIDVDQEMRELETLLQNHPSQQAQAEKLKAFTIRHLKQLQQGIKLRQNKGLDAAIDNRPMLLLDEARLLTQQIEAVEIVGLRQKQLAATSTAIQAIVTFLAGITLNLAIILWTYHLIRRETLKRNQAEADLQESNQTLQDQTSLMQLILNSMSDGVIVADENGQSLIFNPAAKQMFGMEIIDTQQEKWAEDYRLFQADQVTPIPTEQLPLVRSLQGEQVDNVEIFARHQEAPQGLWLTASSRPLKDASGALKGGVVVFRDVSDRKKAEIEIQQSEERYRHLITATSQLFWIAPPDGIVIQDNLAWREYTGQTWEEYQGVGWLDAIHPEDRLLMAQSWGDAVKTFSPYQQEFRLRRHDGEYRYTLTSGVPVLKLDGSIREWIGTCSDIHDRKSAELALAQAKEAAEAANRTKSEFLANMNHELRTPLNGILGYAQILQRDPTTTSKQQKGLGIIYQCGTHLLTLINDILDLSKLEVHKMDLYSQDFHFANFLSTTVEICRIKAEQKGIAFHYHPAANLPTAVHADDKRLRQVLLNLLSNAVKFTDFGSVTFTIEAIKNENIAPIPSTKIRFQVADTGIGIQDEKLQFIFLPFEQAGKRDRNSEGTGLGLAISQQIVQMMGNSIQVKSTLGKGSIFWFEVDLLAAADWLTQPASSNQKVIGYQGERRKILVIDDRPENRAVVMGMLTPLGFKLAQADDGQAGLDLALQMRPDLIITDVMMSKMNGLEMTRRLRQLPDFAVTPIIASPASLSQVDMQEAIDAGCSSFFPKPLEFTGLLGELQRHLQLQWIYETAEDAEVSAVVPSVAELVVPSSSELTTLYRAAQDGFMSDIQQEANRLKQLNPLYVPFANKLLELSQRFDDEAILNLLAPHI